MSRRTLASLGATARHIGCRLRLARRPVVRQGRCVGGWWGEDGSRRLPTRSGLLRARLGAIRIFRAHGTTARSRHWNGPANMAGRQYLTDEEKSQLRNARRKTA